VGGHQVQIFKKVNQKIKTFPTFGFEMNFEYFVLKTIMGS